jgi:hypothetical protein
MMKCEKYGERRGAAFGLAGVVKGFRITSLKKYGIAATLQQALADRYVTLPLHQMLHELVDAFNVLFKFHDNIEICTYGLHKLLHQFKYHPLGPKLIEFTPSFPHSI